MCVCVCVDERDRERGKLHSQLCSRDEAPDDTDESEVLQDRVALDQILLSDIPSCIKDCCYQTQHVTHKHSRP